VSEDIEPWNNGYARDGDTEALLRRLQAGPLTDEQIVRSCLKEIASLLSPPDKARMEAGMVACLAGFVVSAGASPAFGNAIASWQEEAEQRRREIDWSRVPPDLQTLCKRRAEYLLDYALGSGWIERIEDESTWRITPVGEQLLAGGGFYMR
jgi:hypothetical protein